MDPAGVVAAANARVAARVVDAAAAHASSAALVASPRGAGCAAAASAPRAVRAATARAIAARATIPTADLAPVTIKVSQCAAEIDSATAAIPMTKNANLCIAYVGGHPTANQPQVKSPRAA